MCVDQGDVSSKLQDKDLNPALSGQIPCHCIDATSLRMSSVNHPLLAHCTESHLSYLCKWEIILSSKTLVLPFLSDTFWCLIFPSKVWSPLCLDLSLLCSPAFFPFCLLIVCQVKYSWWFWFASLNETEFHFIYLRSIFL